MDVDLLIDLLGENIIGGPIDKTGYLFLTEEHLCYNSNILGSKNKIVSHFNSSNKILHQMNNIITYLLTNQLLSHIFFVQS